MRGFFWVLQRAACGNIHCSSRNTKKKVFFFRPSQSNSQPRFSGKTRHDWWFICYHISWLGCLLLIFIIFMLFFSLPPPVLIQYTHFHSDCVLLWLFIFFRNFFLSFFLMHSYRLNGNVDDDDDKTQGAILEGCTISWKKLKEVSICGALFEL